LIWDRDGGFLRGRKWLVPTNPKISSFRQRALLLSALAVAAWLLPVGQASAQNFFERLFGGGSRSSPAPLAQAFADPFGMGETSEPQAAPRGPSVTYCVRLCDGQHFPVPRNASMTQAQACNSFCPASKTKVFSGGGIDHASASDGTRYADLANAFAYREHVVPGCTCNGRTPGGLASMDVNADPTLRPGDIVATNNGFTAFKGTKKGAAEFTPLSAEARRKLADVKVTPAPESGPQAEIAPSDTSPSGSEERRRAQLSR
jgi:hypothetical protein